MRIARAQLAQHRDEQVAHQGINLVNEQDRGLAGPAAPTVEEFAQRGRAQVDQVTHDGIRAVVAQGQPRLAAHLLQQRGHAFIDPLAIALRHFEVDVQAAVAALRVQVVAQRQQRGSLAGLPGRMQHEVLLLTDQAQDVS